MKILLIEDDQPTAAFVEKGLRQAGHEVDLSGDGREGLVDALEDWMRSGEEARISAALEVARALQLVELREAIAELLRAALREDAAVPEVYRSVPALRSRWRIAHRRQLERVLRQLS